MYKIRGAMQKMVKLIASDIDGTLLTGEIREISEKTIQLIEKLNKEGIVFVAASGRTYSNLKRLFAPVCDDIMYICENGALVKYKNETLFKAVFEADVASDIIDGILKKDNCEVLISGENTSYLIPKEDSFVDHMKNFVKNDVTVVSKFEDIKEPILKISVYNKFGVDDVCDYFDSKWNAVAQCTVSGKCWQDFVPPNVDKGSALELIQKKYCIESDVTMCFGDNYNDLTMFEKAHFSYAMSTAKSEIRARARYVTMSVESILSDVEKMINFNL